MFFCILILMWISSSNCQNDFFVVRRYYERTMKYSYYCVTNSSLPLAWVDDGGTDFHQESAFYPSTDSKWQFDPEKVEKWTTQNSLFANGVINELILDRRWEALDTISTRKKVNEESKILYFINPLSLPSNDFTIPMSINIENEAHIFLCDNVIITQSNCYWLLLYGFAGTKSAVRKCSKMEVTIEDEKFLPESCNSLRATFPYGTSSTLSKGIWMHFKLRKQGKRLTFNQMYEKSEANIINYSDESETPINVKFMILHSKRAGLWKIHNITYMYTTNKTNKVQFGPPIKVIDNSICISMFISMCPSCELKLIISRKDNPYEILKEESYKNIEAGWHEVRIIMQDNIKTQQVILLITTKNSNGEQGFWAIDGIKLCQKTGYRMIATTEPAKCQLVSRKRNVISTERDVTNFNDSCPENTVGKHCIPFSWIYRGNTNGLKICETYGTQIKCSCSAGFVGYNCSEKCSSGTFGYNCAKKCENCYDSMCNQIDGICTFGEIDILLRNGHRPRITITNVSYTDVDVELTDFELDNVNANIDIILQYKKDDKNYREWIFILNKEIKLKQKYKIKNLEVGTKYLVRCIFAINRKITDERDNLPTEKFTTKCDDISSQNIEIKPSNTSVDIFLKAIQEENSCRFNIYKISLNDTGNLTFFTETNVYFDGLKPSTNYEVIFNNCVTKFIYNFKTSEGGKVSGLTLTKQSPYSIKLEWEKSNSLDGELKNYVLEYQLESYQACIKNTTTMPPKIIKNVTSISLLLENLHPYSKYRFSVSARNKKLDGPPNIKWLITDSSDMFSEQELIEVMETEAEATEVNVEFNAADCGKFWGPLLIKLEAECSNEWCQSNLMGSFSYPERTSFQLKNLMPYSDYDLEIKYCRNETFCNSATKHKTFKTKSTTPHSVKNVMVYSKNDSSISLRWEPPYPPTGVLEEYKIAYGFSSLLKEDTFPVSSCDIWPTHHCAKLENLNNNTNYKIEIQAKNRESNDYGKKERIQAVTKKEKPEIPYELTIHWTLKNDLELTWKHPNKTNGDIQYFLIRLLTRDNKKNIVKTLNINTFQPTYYHKVQADSLLPSTPYRIIINAFNDFTSEDLVANDTSPPALPSLDTDPKIFVDNNNIHLQISANNLKKQNENCKLFILVHKATGNSLPDPELVYLKKIFQIDFLDFKIEHEFQIKNLNRSEFTFSRNIDNITIVLTNTYNNKTSFKIYFLGKSLKPESETVANLSLLWLLLLLLIIPIAFIGYKILKCNSLKTSILCRSSCSSDTIYDEIPLSSERKFNEDSQMYSNRISLTDLEQYIKESIANGEFDRQLKMLPNGQTKPWTCGILEENKSKNRRMDTIAYDHTRVVLPKINGKEHSDYINANYIDGYNMAKAYIATQGPKISTSHDFWRMIWQENVKNIVMLANIFESGEKKVEKYWPENNKSLYFEDITIQHISSQVYADYERRDFNVIYNNKTRTLQQYHFLSWPDHGVPLYSQSLIPFLKAILKIPLSSKSPVVVHSSTGVGRNGTILLCDICLRMAAKEGSINILSTLQKLREQRPNMVDNVLQYKFAHLIILQYLAGKRTDIRCQKLKVYVKASLKNGQFRKQMKYVDNVAWQDQALLSKKNEEKGNNRFRNINQKIRSCVSHYHEDDENPVYVDAVNVAGFKNPGKFVVIKQPPQNRLGDFWKFVHEREILVIVSLNEINLENKNSCKFWPDETNPQMTPLDFIILNHVSTTSLQHYNLITIHLCQTFDEPYKKIEIISMKNWQAKTPFPKQVKDFLIFWKETHTMYGKSKPVLVTCHDGIEASGLYVAMDFIIEKMRLEQYSDVCLAVRTIRCSQNQFVRSEKQFTFLYQAAVAFMDEFGEYGNFD